MSALLAILLAFIEVPGGKLSGGARAYFESAYISSTSGLSYTRPVAEQYYDISYTTDEYGGVRFDCWCISAFSDQQSDSHDREFYCWEPTLVYFYDWKLADDGAYRISSGAGVLWDWLRGYYTGLKVPYCWYAYQSFVNPYLIPYWNGLGGFENTTTWSRIRVGLQHDWKPTKTITLSPFVDATWGNPERFKKNYGVSLEDSFLGGSFMTGNVGVLGRWYFTESWYLWARYRHIFTIDDEARRAQRTRSLYKDKTSYPSGGLGIGVRF